MKKLLCVMASTLLLASCNAPTGKSSVLNVELPLRTTTLEPYMTEVPVTIGALETLFKVSKEGKAEPFLVKSFQQVSDREIKMTLKDNIKFQNGHSVDAEAVKKSLLEAVQKSDILKGTFHVERIDAKGLNLTIKMQKSYPNLASELSHPETAIFDTTDKNVKKAPVGTGPYQITDYERSQKIIMKKNNDYWHGEPQLDGINVTFQEDGNVRTDDLVAGTSDLTTDIPMSRIKELQQSKEVKVESIPGFRTHYLMYNHQKMDLNKRKALDALIDRQAVADTIFHHQAQPAAGPFNTSLSYIDDKKVKEQNIEEAKKIIAAAGYTSAQPLKLQMITYNGRPELPAIAQVIQSDAKKANIDISIKNVDDILGYLADRQDWDMATYSLMTLPAADTSYLFNMAYMKEGSSNYGHYSNPEVTALVDRMSRTVDEQQRIELTNQILKLTREDVSNSYISYNPQVAAMSDKVKHLQVTPQGNYLIDEKVSIEND